MSEERNNDKLSAQADSGDPVARGGPSGGTSNPDVDQSLTASADGATSDPVTGPGGGSGTTNPDHDVDGLVAAVGDLRGSEQRNLAISVLLALFHLALALLVDCLELVNFLLAVLHGVNAAFTYRTLQATADATDPVTGGQGGGTSNVDHDTDD